MKCSGVSFYILNRFAGFLSSPTVDSRSMVAVRLAENDGRSLSGGDGVIEWFSDTDGSLGFPSSDCLLSSCPIGFNESCICRSSVDACSKEKDLLNEPGERHSQ